MQTFEQMNDVPAQMYQKNRVRLILFPGLWHPGLCWLAFRPVIGRVPNARTRLSAVAEAQPMPNRGDVSGR